MDTGLAKRWIWRCFHIFIKEGDETMERQEVVQKVRKAIKTVLGETEVDTHLSLREETNIFQTGLEFSSLDGVMLIVELERIFDIQWPDDLLNFDDLLTIGEVSDIIEECLLHKKEVTTE